MSILAMEEDAHEISYLIFDLEDGVVGHFGYWVLCVVVKKMLFVVISWRVC